MFTLSCLPCLFQLYNIIGDGTLRIVRDGYTQFRSEEQTPGMCVPLCLLCNLMHYFLL